MNIFSGEIKQNGINDGLLSIPINLIYSDNEKLSVLTFLQPLSLGISIEYDSRDFFIKDYISFYEQILSNLIFEVDIENLSEMKDYLFEKKLVYNHSITDCIDTEDATSIDRLIKIDSFYGEGKSNVLYYDIKTEDFVFIHFPFVEERNYYLRKYCSTKSSRSDFSKANNMSNFLENKI